MTKEIYLPKLKRRDRKLFSQVYDALTEKGYDIQVVGSVVDGPMKRYNDIDLIVKPSSEELKLSLEEITGFADQYMDIDQIKQLLGLEEMGFDYSMRAPHPYASILAPVTRHIFSKQKCGLFSKRETIFDIVFKL